MIEKQKQQTSADIIAEMRLGLNKSWHDIDREWARDLPDRLEAVLERELRDIAMEHAVLPAVCITKKPDGNAAKMREALESCRDFIMRLDRAFNPFMQKLLEDTITKADAALAAPVRNCDVGTAEEQEARFGAFCEQHSKDGARELCDERCPILTDYRSECALRWAQMPYEESEANKCN